MGKLTRRQFLGGATLGAVGVAATSALGGCAPTTANHAAEENETAASSENHVASWIELNPQEPFDSATTDFSALFSEVKVGPMTLKNRLCKSAAGSDTAIKKSPTISQNAIDYYGRIADGGTALVILEEGIVSGFGMSPFNPMVCETVEAGIEEARRIVNRVHEGGACIGTQLGIGTPIEPGDVNAYTLEEIKQMVTDFGVCAARIKQAGFDCIEIKGATTDGLNQFVSRRANRREDEYGADTEENRLRFFREIIAEIRAQCGSDFAILTLINAVEENDTNLGANDKHITIEESKALAKALEEAGADAIQVRVGAVGQEASCWATDVMHAPYGVHGATGYGTQFDFSSHFGGLMDGAHDGAGAFIPLAREIKGAVSVPVGCASYMDPRIAPDLIDGAVADGSVDLVFMNRPLTVDPELPIKLEEGRIDEVAPCTRCFHCHGKPYGEAEACRVNPTTQFAYTDEFPEGYDVTPAPSPKKVMVIGGGVAGMQAAITAAQRGHSVTLHEASASTGGLLSFAEAIKGTHEHLSVLKDYLAHQLKLADVAVATDAEATIDTVKETNPDAVIVAVGGVRERRFDQAISMDDYATAEIGSSVIILGANLQAVDMAQKMLAEGKTVTLVHEDDESTVDAGQSYWVRKYTKAHMYSHGIKIWNNVNISHVENGSVTFSTQTGLEKTISADTIIECFDMVPNMALFDEIKAAGYDVYAAGCDAPNNIQSAIHAGYKVARYLD